VSVYEQSLPPQTISWEEAKNINPDGNNPGSPRIPVEVKRYIRDNCPAQYRGAEYFHQIPMSVYMKMSPEVLQYLPKEIQQLIIEEKTNPKNRVPVQKPNQERPSRNPDAGLGR